MKDSINETMYFPMENGLTLSQDGVLPYSTLMVEGQAFSDVGQGSTRTQTRTNFAAKSLSSSSNAPSSSIKCSIYCIPGECNYYIQIIGCKAATAFIYHKTGVSNITRTGRRVEFHTTGQTFVTISESSAHTDFLVNCSSPKVGLRSCHITKDVLKIDNSPATQGTIQFYYCGSLFNQHSIQPVYSLVRI